MTRIDDPIDQIEKQHEEPRPNQTFEIMMAGLSGLPLVGAINAIRQYASSTSMRERFESLIRETLGSHSESWARYRIVKGKDRVARVYSGTSCCYGENNPYLKS